MKLQFNKDYNENLKLVFAVTKEVNIQQCVDESKCPVSCVLQQPAVFDRRKWM